MSEPWEDWDQWNQPYRRAPTSIATSLPPEPQEPLTVDSILRDIAGLKDWQRKTGAKPLEPIEVTPEQWEVLKSTLPVRSEPWVFALGVPVIVRPVPSPPKP